MTRASMLTGALVLLAGLSSCGRLFAVGTLAEEQWEETSEFEMQPGSMNPAEAEQALRDHVRPAQVVSGTAVHRASVLAPSGSVDFFAYRVVDPDIGPQPVFCTLTVAGSSSFGGCGGEGLEIATHPVQVNGESWGGLWRTADFLVQDDVDRVVATAEDGTVYTVSGLNGLGFIEWPDERGSLELVAYDAAGDELGRTFAGLDQ